MQVSSVILRTPNTKQPRNLEISIRIFVILYEFLDEFYNISPIILFFKTHFKLEEEGTIKDFVLKAVVCFSIGLLCFGMPNVIQLANGFAPICYVLVDFVLPLLCYLKLFGENMNILKKVGIFAWITIYTSIAISFIFGGMQTSYQKK